MRASSRRRLYGDEARALLYAVLGLVLFAFVLNGFMQASAVALNPPAEPAVRRAAPTGEKEKPREAVRHVPPAEVQFPVY